MPNQQKFCMPIIPAPGFSRMSVDSPILLTGSDVELCVLSVRNIGRASSEGDFVKLNT